MRLTFIQSLVIFCLKLLLLKLMLIIQEGAWGSPFHPHLLLGAMALINDWLLLHKLFLLLCFINGLEVPWLFYGFRCDHSRFPFLFIIDLDILIGFYFFETFGPLIALRFFWSIQLISRALWFIHLLILIYFRILELENFEFLDSDLFTLSLIQFDILALHLIRSNGFLLLSRLFRLQELLQHVISLRSLWVQVDAFP